MSEIQIDDIIMLTFPGASERYPYPRRVTRIHTHGQTTRIWNVATNPRDHPGEGASVLEDCRLIGHSTTNTKEAADYYQQLISVGDDL